MRAKLHSHGHDEPDIVLVESIVKDYGLEKRKLISILQDVQEEYNYLPRNALKLIATHLELPERDVFNVATFYKGFSLEPRGDHLISACLGTACHVRRAASILKEIERLLGIEPGQTTEDRRFSLERVNCLGACAIGPVVVIDGQYHGQMNVVKVRELISQYSTQASEDD